MSRDARDSAQRDPLEHVAVPALCHAMPTLQAREAALASKMGALQTRTYRFPLYSLVAVLHAELDQSRLRLDELEDLFSE